MSQRLAYEKLAAAPYQALLSVSAALEQSGLEPKLVGLVNLRASQINGCAFCISMHTNELLALAESESRIHLLSVWEEVDLYTEREKAALAWTETVTRIADNHAPQEAYDAVLAHFIETEVANLTLAIAMINAYNRLAISFRKHPLTVRQPRKQEAAV